MIKGCVLRGWQKTSNDVDLIVDEQTFRNLVEELQPVRFYDTYHAFILDKGRAVDLHIHVDKLSWNYIPYLKWSGKCRNVGKSLVPEEHWYVAEIILHSIVDSKKFKEEHIKDIESFRDWETLEALLSKNLGAIQGKIITNLAKEKNYNGLLRLRWKILRNSALRNPLSIPLALWIIISKKISKALPRRGPLFIFVGPDGSGKTTLVKETKKFLEELGLRVSARQLGIYNKRSFPLRTMAAIRGSNKGYLKVPSALKNMARFVDMWLRYAVCELDRMRGRVVVSDRFFYDLAFYSDGRVGELLATLSPKPTKGFLAYVDVDSLLKRKQEYGREELSSHLGRMLRKAGKFGLIKIETRQLSRSMETVKSELLKTKKLVRLLI